MMGPEPRPLAVQGPGVSVIICAYALGRWSDLQKAVESVLAQRAPVQEVLVVIDHNAELLDRARDRWRTVAEATPAVRPVVLVLANSGARGLSGARNSGVCAARSEILAFLDDDAEADPSWMGQLLAPYQEPGVVACGGAAIPALAGPRPGWWPIEFDWVVGCSYLGLPTGQAVVRNLIGANMSARREAVVGVGGFSEGIGRVGSRPLGCEETDLYIRIAQRWPDSQVVYEPAAEVQHTVPTARLSWRYFRARCFAEGLSKAQVAARMGSGQALASERSYVLKVLPRGVASAMRDAVRGEPAAGLRALAIVAGLTLTTAGYVRGRMSAAAGSPLETPLVAAA